MTSASRLLRAVLPVTAAVLVTASLLAPAAQAATPPSRTTAISYAKSVFNLLNQERAYHGLPAYRWDANLARAAHAHNAKMAQYNSLSHQLPGESTLGTRLRAVGYNWSACAENIGYTVTAAWTLTEALNLHKLMFNEVAPNDSHRRAILSRTYRDVGIDLVFDATHRKMWLTEDFGHLA